MVVSVGQASACEGTDLGKRPRSPSPTDIKISNIANSILTKEAALPVIQNMYNKATYRTPKIIKLEDLAEIDLVLSNNGAIRSQRLKGYYSKEVIAEGGESRLFPVVSNEGKSYVFFRAIHTSQPAPIPEISRVVGKNAFQCAYFPKEVQPEIEPKAIFRYQLAEHANEGDLKNFVRRKNLSERENNALPNLGLQLLEKTLVLHKDGGAHCDIKPGNLLVHNTNEVLELFIGDFGWYTREEARSGRCGTRGYRGPEGSELFKFFDKEYMYHDEHKPEKYDPKSLDRYAVGVSLFELLTKESLATVITKWVNSNTTPEEETFHYTKEDFQAFRQGKIESFLEYYISQAAKGSLIKVPEFAEVIKGLIQEVPEKRIPLESAIALWKQGLDRIKSANN
jgi:serine/threonine protein kinase